MEFTTHNRIIPVVVVETPDQALATAEALLEGGISIMEITLRTSKAVEAIAAVRDRFAEMTVGAGTVLTPSQIDQVCDASVSFAVSPGLNETIVTLSRKRNTPFIPGVMTPSDVEKALSLNCRVLKFFPAEAAGGTATLKALAGPYSFSGVTFIPLGGVNISNARDYLALPIVAGIGGTWIADKASIKEQNWSEITRRARQAKDLLC